MRRQSRFYPSLQRNKTIMGVEKTAFMIEAFLASAFFANSIYPLLVLIPPLHIYLRMMTKRDFIFSQVLLKFLNEGDAFSSIPRPQIWQGRPAGWGKGLPW